MYRILQSYLRKARDVEDANVRVSIGNKFLA